MFLSDEIPHLKQPIFAFKTFDPTIPALIVSYQNVTKSERLGSDD